MRIVMAFVVIALMALLGASLFYAYGIWTALGAADMPGWMYAAMAGGVVFSLLVGGGLMGLVFYSARAGYDDRALRRIARLADGWFPHSPPGVAPGAGPEIIGETLARLRTYLVEEGRDATEFRVNGTIRMLDRTPDQWRAGLEAWRVAGASHATLSTITSPDQAPEDHLAAMRRFREEVMAGQPG